MFRSLSLAMFLMSCLLIDTPVNATESDKSQNTYPHVPFEIGNRKDPDRDQLLAFAKTFCVAMRRYSNEANLESLREFFDPRYLQKHNLTEGGISFRTVAVVDIYNIQVSDDPTTILCFVSTKENTKEVILLRTTVHEGKLYLLPLNEPDPKTRSFTPWILRTKL